MTRFCLPRPAFALAFLLFASPAFAAPFTDNLDGTVTDDATGLMWDKCSWGQTWDDIGNTCSVAELATTHDWAEALALAITANNDSHLGYNDWRLPNRTELESLVDLSISQPAIDGTAFPNTPWLPYWTSTTYAHDPGYAWIVDFYNGSTFPNNPKNYTETVRLVRGGQSFAAFDDQVQAQDDPDPAAIPTLAEWTLLMLAGLLALIGFGWLRRPFPRRDA